MCGCPTIKSFRTCFSHQFASQSKIAISLIMPPALVVPVVGTVWAFSESEQSERTKKGIEQRHYLMRIEAKKLSRGYGILSVCLHHPTARYHTTSTTTTTTKNMKNSHIHTSGTLPVIYLSIERDRKIPHLYYTQWARSLSLALSLFLSLARAFVRSNCWGDQNAISTIENLIILSLYHGCR